MKFNQNFFFLSIIFLIIFQIFCKEDPSTFSNYNQLVQTHLEASFNVDFNNTKIIGKAKLTFKAITDGSIIVLDTKALNIKSIIDSDTGDDLEFALDDEHELDSIGKPLKIYKEFKTNQIFSIVIDYETTHDGSAVQFLEPSQTTGKVYPFMYTQCESILARELIPIQDTPLIKLTVEAGVTVVKPLRGLFSGIFQSSIDNGESVTYFYSQKTPIPSYLIALAAGDIKERQISDRTKIYAESEIVDKAVEEFSDTENFLEIAEAYVYPYEWGEYNLLILPSSFSYGGMENPTLTFVTPSLIAGDKSLADVVAHELSHSWSGNLVTMKSWSDFFLNEGFTMFLQRKIMEVHLDKDMAKMSALFDYSRMEEDIIKFGEAKSFSSLRPYLIGRHADDAFSEIPYEKGFNFLYFIEQVVNGASGKDTFKLILRRYFENFKYQSLKYTEFRDFFIQKIRELLPDQAEKILDKIKWDEWVNTPGFPIAKNDFTNSYSVKVNECLNKFYNGTLDKDFVNTFKGWHTILKQFFLQSIFKKGIKLSKEQKNILVNDLGLLNGYNSEVTFNFLRVLMNNCEDVTDEEINAVIKFLGTYGRMKFLRPLYIDFYKINKDLCLKTFNEFKSRYEKTAARLIELDLMHIII